MVIVFCVQGLRCIVVSLLRFAVSLFRCFAVSLLWFYFVIMMYRYVIVHTFDIEPSHRRISSHRGRIVVTYRYTLTKLNSLSKRDGLGWRGLFWTATLLARRAIKTHNLSFPLLSFPVTSTHHHPPQHHTLLLFVDSIPYICEQKNREEVYYHCKLE